jgi:hypothetical protein
MCREIKHRDWEDSMGKVVGLKGQHVGIFIEKVDGTLITISAGVRFCLSSPISIGSLSTGQDRNLPLAF